MAVAKQACFMQLGFSMKLTHLSPVQYWSVSNTKHKQIESKWNEVN